MAISYDIDTIENDSVQRTATLTDDSGNAVDLSSAVGVTFYWELDNVPASGSQVCTISDATNGVVIVTTNFDTVGSGTAQFRVAYSGSYQTYPSPQRLTLIVRPSLAA